MKECWFSASEKWLFIKGSCCASQLPHGRQRTVMLLMPICIHWIDLWPNPVSHPLFLNPNSLSTAIASTGLSPIHPPYSYAQLHEFSIRSPIALEWLWGMMFDSLCFLIERSADLIDLILWFPVSKEEGQLDKRKHIKLQLLFPPPWMHKASKHTPKPKL